LPKTAIILSKNHTFRAIPPLKPTMFVSAHTVILQENKLTASATVSTSGFVFLHLIKFPVLRKFSSTVCPRTKETVTEVLSGFHT